MHGLAKQANKRTDPQNRRMTARAANATSQVIPRNRSLMIWGEKKAVTKNHPNGEQEIMAPQASTGEQEVCQLHPRSKFLKKLAAANKKQPLPVKQQRPLDQSTLRQYFSKKPDKDQVVMDWMSEVERHSRQQVNTIQPSPTPSGHKIQFKSETGKRWANRIQNTSLQAPSDNCQKHHVPRRLLTNKKIPVTETVARIQTAWKEQQPQHYIESKVGMIAMANTGERTPIAGIVQIVQMLNKSLKLQEQNSADRIEKLESLLKEEKKKREAAEASIKKLEQSVKKKAPIRRPLPTRPIKK